MIKTFGTEDTDVLLRGGSVRKFKNIERIIQRKLLMIDAATELDDLRVPPGNRLELLKGKWKGYYSIRANDQWRICFHWNDGNAYDVQIEDYH